MLLRDVVDKSWISK